MDDPEVRQNRVVRLADDVIRQMRDRPAMQVWLATADSTDERGFDDIATTAGIEPLGRGWIEVDADRASRFLVGLLHKDLAYKSELMPRHRAEWLAGEFLSSFGRFNSRFATNSPDMPHEFPFSWTPATDFTFDAGVVVIGESGCGLYWVADED